MLSLAFALALILQAEQAAAQSPAADPIGEILVPQAEDEDKAEEAGAREPAPARAPGLPAGPQPYTSLQSAPAYIRPIQPRPLLRLPPAPRGSLDGAWTLALATGPQLYQFQLNDRDIGDVEGAWRDLRRVGALLSSGPLSTVSYDGVSLTLRFYERGSAEPSVVTLTRSADGTWAGDITGQGGQAAVTMRREP